MKSKNITYKFVNVRLMDVRVSGMLLMLIRPRRENGYAGWGTILKGCSIDR